MDPTQNQVATFVLSFVLLPAETQPWMLAHYVVSVAITVAIGIGLGAALTRFAPKVFVLFNGRRSLASG